ncbi:hypothetical protein [Streptomyces echinatus]|uniref:Lipoprotein n=1 Tax=Streptomyces echinatus TaxID=67293 RepID=A0A7W9PN32_9ACTN|nr:hypothetical protein [Streptomyces echinatus]MBB5924790.1 hypothetical protein [Streptomyces echinatus]
MFKAPPRPARWTAVLLLPLLLVAACGAEKRSTVPADRIVGTWTAADGEEMSFAADRSFTSSGLDSKKLSEQRCPGQKATGTWAFFADQGDGLYGTSARATSGSQIGFTFDDEAEGPCTITLSVVEDGKTLCATADADDPCGLGVRFTRRK